MDISSRYEASDIEPKWYQHWIEQGYHHSEPDDREPYTIVIPPPNVTGVLHMGHMLDNTIQDALIRKAKLDGKNTCWVPGTDHASIATEAKVVRWLRDEKGTSKGAVGRERFVEYAWEWTEKYGGIIFKQLERLGALCDWERSAFTMDEKRSKMVIEVFVDLYRKGHIYRGLRMVNWDPEAQTVLSNEEVIYSNETTFLNYVRYFIEDSDEYIIVATTRPETIFGDTALAVHPEDERYSRYKGKKVNVPGTNRMIPIIFDSYVDQSFGTGALKVTPAHDPNDYEIGLRHNLEIIDVLNADGSLNDKADFLVGLTREKGRIKMALYLEENGLLEKKEKYDHSVGRSERTNVVVEPRLSKQWYVRMKELAKPALDNVMNDTVSFFPKSMKNSYRHWMENVRDWCISRQLWWGHRIPAFYYEDHIFVAQSKAEALKEAQETLGITLAESDLRQDEDVLDTWFSSWLWPFSVFNGLHKNEAVDYYYPTSILVTGWDIMFLWVARMIISGYEWKGTYPFKEVYFHGMVRDKKRRKMSKSLGNSPDALKLLDSFGADGVRFGMLSASPAGADILFDEKLCEQGRNFCNKIWNALRLVKSWESTLDESTASDLDTFALKWFKIAFNKALLAQAENFETYRISENLIDLYTLIWDDFCSWFLEMVKPAKGESMSRSTYDQIVEIFESLMVILHPYMPFITEEVWHQLRNRSTGDDCLNSRWPETFDTIEEKEQIPIKDIVSRIRDIRNKNQIKPREALQLAIVESSAVNAILAEQGFKDTLSKLAVLSQVEMTDHAPEEANWISATVGADSYHIYYEQERDFAAEREELTKELSYQEGFVKAAEKKLSNERFVNNAPAAVVEKEQQKLEDGRKRIAMIRQTLSNLKAHATDQ